MNQQKVPQLFVATGATKWNDPKNFPWTMGWQPNYQTEGRIYAAYVLKNVPDAKVGILYQNDDYGKDYLKGFKDGLGDAAKKLIVLEQTLRGDGSHHRLADRQPEEQRRQRVLQHHDPKFAAQAIKKAHDIGWKPMHFLNNVSSSLGAVLKPAGLEASKGLITALYMKESDRPAVEERQGLQGLGRLHEEVLPGRNALDDQSNVYGYTWPRRWPRCSSSAATTSRARTS